MVVVLFVCLFFVCPKNYNTRQREIAFRNVSTNKNKKPKRLENSQLLRKTSHLNQIFELILKQCVANYYMEINYRKIIS